MNTRNKSLVESFVKSMEESIRRFANGRLSDSEVKYLAEYQVNRLDFNNSWQMHKGLGYFARAAVNNYLSSKN